MPARKTKSRAATGHPPSASPGGKKTKTVTTPKDSIRAKSNSESAPEVTFSAQCLQKMRGGVTPPKPLDDVGSTNKWKCNMCDEFNSGNAGKCSICWADRATSLKKPSPDKKESARREKRPRIPDSAQPPKKRGRALSLPGPTLRRRRPRRPRRCRRGAFRAPAAKAEKGVCQERQATLLVCQSPIADSRSKIPNRTGSTKTSTSGDPTGSSWTRMANRAFSASFAKSISPIAKCFVSI